MLLGAAGEGDNLEGNILLGEDTGPGADFGDREIEINRRRLADFQGLGGGGEGKGDREKGN